MEENQLAILISKFLENKLSGEELVMFREFVGDEGNKDLVVKGMVEVGMEWPAGTIDEGRFEVVLGRVLEVDKGKVPRSARDDKGAVPLKVRRMWWWAAAASIIIMLAIWLLLPRSAREKNQIATTQDIEAPKAAKATITLANGKVIVPEVINGKVEVVKETEYNILNNPRGSKVVNLTLSDGTMVWLNSESSLKYPVVFGQERKVEITGEAYFECKTPGFIVVAKGIEIEDLGTEFNVNSYEGTVTTLVKGKVILRSAQDDKEGLVLKPGDQASGQKLVASGVDLEEVTAWKNGKFHFNSADITEIMKEIGRWYDLDIVFEGKVSSERYRGKVSRDLSLMELLRVLELNKIKTKLEGRRLVIGN